MPDKKKRKKVTFAEKPNLQCEWADCTKSFRFGDWKDFITHIKRHLTEVDIESLESIKCYWRDCTFEMSAGISELLRHMFFHAYHVKLKVIGMSILSTNKYGSCRLDSGSRNVIPHLPDRFCCGAENCGAEFDIPDEHYKHVKVHLDRYPESAKETGYYCYWQDCKEKFKTVYTLEAHMKCHTQEKKLACPTCGSLFSTYRKFIHHLARQAYDDCQYQCSHCKKTFLCESLLTDHMLKHVHKFKCKMCDMTTSTLSNLRSHMKSRHLPADQFVCNNCGNQYRSVRSLKRHFDHCKKTEHTKTCYVCPEEGCVFTSTYDFLIAQHIKNKHSSQKEIKYQCHLCSKDYTRGTKLSQHLQKKHGYVLPPGHCKFTYALQPEGFYKLQMERYESFDLRQHHEFSQNDATIAPHDDLVRLSAQPPSVSNISEDSRGDDASTAELQIACSSQASDEDSAQTLTVDSTQLASGVQVVCKDGQFKLLSAGAESSCSNFSEVSEASEQVQSDTSGMYNLKMLGAVASAMTPPMQLSDISDAEEDEPMVIDSSFLEITPAEEIASQEEITSHEELTSYEEVMSPEEITSYEEITSPEAD